MSKWISAGALVLVMVVTTIFGVIHRSDTPLNTNSPAAFAATSATGVPVVYEVRSNIQTRSIWQYTGTPLTGWREIGAPDAQTESVVADASHVYQLQLNGHILVYSGSGTTWNMIGMTGTAANPGGEITLSSTGQLYKEDTNGAWKYESGTTWTQLGSSANSAPLGQLFAGPNGALYSIGNTGGWEYTGPPITGWKEIDNTTLNGVASAFSLVATPNGKLYAIRAGITKCCPVWEYQGKPFSWTQISTKAGSSIAGDGKSHLYQQVTGGEIWRYSGSGTTWTDLKNPDPAQSELLSTSGSAAGLLFDLLNTGAVWMLKNGTWTQIDDSTSTFLVASSAGGQAVNGAG